MENYRGDRLGRISTRDSRGESGDGECGRQGEGTSTEFGELLRAGGTLGRSGESGEKKWARDSRSDPTRRGEGGGGENAQRIDTLREGGARGLRGQLFFSRCKAEGGAGGKTGSRRSAFS